MYVSRRSVLGTSVALLGSLTAGCSGTGNTGTQTTTPDSDPQTRWRTDVGIPAGNPIYADGSVVVGSGEAVVCLDATSGAELWRTGFDQGIRDGPVVADETVYVATGEYGLGGTPTLHALSLDDGAKRGAFRPEVASGSRARLSILGATPQDVYVATVDDVQKSTGETLYAVTGDGSAQWSADVGDPRGGIVAGETVFTVTRTRLYAHALNGTKRWQFEPGGDVFAPRVAGGTAYVVGAVSDTSGSRSLFALDVETGEQKWAFDSWDVSTVARGTRENSVYVAGSRLASLDTSDGATQWDVDTQSLLTHPDPVSRGRLVAGGDAVTAYAVDNGERQWRVDPGNDDDLATVAAVSPKTVYVARQDERLEARSLTDGTRTWTVSGHVDGPALDGNADYVTTGTTVLARSDA